METFLKAVPHQPMSVEVIYPVGLVGVVAGEARGEGEGRERDDGRGGRLQGSPWGRELPTLDEAEGREGMGWGGGGEGRVVQGGGGQVGKGVVGARWYGAQGEEWLLGCERAMGVLMSVLLGCGCCCWCHSPVTAVTGANHAASGGRAMHTADRAQLGGGEQLCCIGSRPPPLIYPLASSCVPYGPA